MSILHTAKAKCVDCYRCVRACPVKAIGIKDGQAFIDEDRCILCGTCIRECPQGAKRYQSDTEAVKELLSEGKVIASIAPSFAAAYSDWKSTRLASALRKLGFYRVEETSIGADIVAKDSKKLVDEKCGGICSACPAVVSYAEKYLPEIVPSIMPLVSPMIAHGMRIKKEHPDAKVVFIGPCIAKKQEASQDKYKGIVDAVLTFSELDKWLDKAGISLSDCPESGFDGIGKTSGAKLFALPGGMLETSGIPDDIKSPAVLHTNGAQNTMMLLNAALNSKEMEVLEPLFCSGGCIGGAGIPKESNLFEKRAALLRYAKMNKETAPESDSNIKVDTKTEFNINPVTKAKVTEQEILNLFEKTGKSDPAKQLNCGACGYSNCRENAIAVLSGMAEVTMCFPYVRSLSEQKMDAIIESTPNGIVMLNDDFNIIAMNSSFKKYFMCADSIIGREISYLISDDNYRKLNKTEGSKVESIVNCYGKQFHNITYYLPSEKQYVGIYVDISQVKTSEKKLEMMRQKTYSQVEALMQHQVEMAQKMTMFLGESTAKGEMLMESILNDEQDK